jgi:membrane associated rhomboid family serine protease
MVNGAIYFISILLSGINMSGSFLEVHYGWFLNAFCNDVEKVRLNH